MKKTILLIAPVMLFLALMKWPYSYYQLLRIVVSVTCAYLIIMPLLTKKSVAWKIWTLAVILVLFNPVFPVYLSRDLWRIIDPAAGVALIFTIFKK